MISPKRGYFSDAVRSPKPAAKIETINHLYKVDWFVAMLPELQNKEGKVIIDMNLKPLQEAHDAASTSFQSQNVFAFEACGALSPVPLRRNPSSWSRWRQSPRARRLTATARTSPGSNYFDIISTALRRYIPRTIVYTL